VLYMKKMLYYMICILHTICDGRAALSADLGDAVKQRCGISCRFNRWPGFCSAIPVQVPCIPPLDVRSSPPKGSQR
jgi:hypothetical protein